MPPNTTLMGAVQTYLASDRLQLPVFSRTAVELQRAIRKDDFSVAKCAALINRDQALASQVLKEANSSFYGGLKKITTVQDAMVRLGTKEVFRITVQVTQKGLYRSSHPLLGDIMGRIWQHALGAALGAWWLARKSGYQSQEQEAFLGGLMHDIGRLFLLKVLDEMAGKGHLQKLSGSLVDEVLDSMHVEQGYRLMCHWDLPEIYADIVKNHHSQDCDEQNPLLLLVQVADAACRKLGIGPPAEPDLVLATVPAAQLLDLRETTLAELEILLEDKFCQPEKQAQAG